jgi:hypothetical protein
VSEPLEQPVPTAAVSREERLAIVSLTRPPGNRIDEELAVWLWECLDGLDQTRWPADSGWCAAATW